MHNEKINHNESPKYIVEDSSISSSAVENYNRKKFANTNWGSNLRQSGKVLLIIILSIFFTLKYDYFFMTLVDFKMFKLCNSAI